MYTVPAIRINMPFSGQPNKKGYDSLVCVMNDDVWVLQELVKYQDVVSYELTEVKYSHPIMHLGTHGNVNVNRFSLMNIQINLF